MATKTVIPGVAWRMEALIEHLEDKYQARQFEVQVLQIQNETRPGKLFQIREAADGGWLSYAKHYSGLATAATVSLIPQGPDLEVEVFGGKWLDKVAVGAVSMVVLWPLLITSGIGAWKQNALLDELYEVASLFLADSADRVSPAPRVTPAPALTAAGPAHCSGCGQPLAAAARFCGDCGQRVVVELGRPRAV